MNKKEKCPECNISREPGLFPGVFARGISYWGSGGSDHMNAHICENKWHEQNIKNKHNQY